MEFKSYANKNFEIMILFQNFWENKSLFSSPVYISESYFVLKIVANHQKCQSCQVCQFKWKTDERKPFFQEGCFSIWWIEGTFPLDLECKFHIACKAENPITIDGNTFKF